MIEYIKGNFWDYAADIRINTVNCVGVMGKGVALQFKNKYPKMFLEYKRLCNSNSIDIGKPHIYRAEDCIIINLPTKKHWRNNSEYEYIKKALLFLDEFLSQFSEDTIVTLPPLGCGCGGLDWNLIKKGYNYYLKRPICKILAFEPY